MGKTRLALAAAAHEAENPAIDGVYFIELAPVDLLDDPLAGKKQQATNQIATGVAQAIGYQFPQNGREPMQQLLDYLGNRTVLLVLDGFEHLMDGARSVSQILQASPGSKVLITSREPLQLVEEQLLPVMGLAFTREMVAESDAAVQLFRQRACRAQPDFVLHQADMPHLTAICRLVGGMPLALELAAAWVTTLTLPDMAAEIERSLEILTADWRNLPSRQRSVTAVIEASWQRLTAAEQRLLGRLSLFPGGFNQLAAQTISGASLPTLAALISKSLLWRDHLPLTAVYGHARFALHELVRRFAAQQLAGDNSEEAAARQAYTRYYAAFLQARQPFLDGPRPQEALAEIALEYANVRQAVLLPKMYAHICTHSSPAI
jgi:predicted ATPase